MVDRDWFAGFRQRYSKDLPGVLENSPNDRRVAPCDTSHHSEEAHRRASHRQPTLRVAPCDGARRREPLSHVSHGSAGFGEIGKTSENQLSSGRHTRHTHVTAVPADPAPIHPEIMHMLPSNDVWSSEDWRAFFDERAGVAEFDGGLPRPEAEARSFDCCVAEWLNRNFVRSPPGRCLACGAVGEDQEPLLPFGTEVSGPCLASFPMLVRVARRAREGSYHCIRRVRNLGPPA